MCIYIYIHNIITVAAFLETTNWPTVRRGSEQQNSKVLWVSADAAEMLKRPGMR